MGAFVLVFFSCSTLLFLSLFVLFFSVVFENIVSL